MQKIVPAIIAFLIMFSPLLADGADLQQPKNQILTRLPNGLLVYIIQDTRFPLVCTRLYVRAGSATEDPKTAGISHVLEHMVFKGTAHRPKGQIAKDVEAMGGYLNAATSFDKTWYITDMPATAWKMGMDVARDMAFQASLAPEELEAEKDVVISELERGEDSPQRKLYENLQVAALKNTPYGRPIIGFVNSIRAITVADLKAYVKKWYQPQNMMLLVAGDINPEDVLAHAEKLFGDLANSSDLAVPEPLSLANAPVGTPVVEVVRGPFQKVYLGVAFPAPSLRDDRSVELDVLSYLMGGDGTSIFYQKYKYAKELVDNIHIGNMSMARAGLFTIAATLDVDKTAEFWENLTDDLGRLSAVNFSDAAISRAKFNLEDSINRAGETLNGLAAWRGSVQFDLGGQQAEENMLFTQRNVDQIQLQNAIRAWLKPEVARVRVLAPENVELPDFEAILNKNWPAPKTSDESTTTAVATGGTETVELPNGCSLILLPDKSAPYISIQLLMPGGNAMLEPDQQGLASLTGRLISDGVGEMGKIALERYLAERASSLSAHAGLQTFGIALEGPTRFGNDLFSLLHSALFKPRFEAGEVVREIRNMKAALARRPDQPLAYMRAKMIPFLFPGNQPYGYDSLGTEETLGKFNAVDVRNFWAKQGGQPWVMAVAGDFDRDAVANFAAKLAAPHTKKFEVSEPVWDTNHALNLTLPGKNQAHLMRIFRTVPVTHPDAPALMLLEAAISGQSGVLFTQLRDQEGLGYTVTAFNRFMPLTGFLGFYIGTTPDKMDSSQKGFDRIIEDLKTTPLPEETLKGAANRLWGAYIRGRQSLDSRASDAAIDTVFGRPLDFQAALLEKARTLGSEEVLAAAQKYLINPYEITLMP